MKYRKECISAAPELFHLSAKWLQLVDPRQNSKCRQWFDFVVARLLSTNCCRIDIGLGTSELNMANKPENGRCNFCPLSFRRLLAIKIQCYLRIIWWKTISSKRFDHIWHKCWNSGKKMEKSSKISQIYSVRCVFVMEMVKLLVVHKCWLELAIRNTCVYGWRSLGVYSKCAADDLAYTFRLYDGVTQIGDPIKYVINVDYTHTHTHIKELGLAN